MANVYPRHYTCYTVNDKVRAEVCASRMLTCVFVRGCMPPQWCPRA